MINKLSLTLLALALLPAFLSCEKNDDDEKKQKIDSELLTAASDEALASTLFDDAGDQADDAHSEEDNERKAGTPTEDCACVSVEVTNSTQDNYQRQISIDFENGCICKGRTRKGKIIVHINGRYRDSGTKKMITFEDYHVDGYQIEGSKTVENMGYNADSKLYFQIEVENGKIIKPKEDTIIWESSRERTWIEGESTLWNIDDDIYEITGNASGKTRNGTPYTKTITKPLIVDIWGCGDVDRTFIKAGTVKTEVENSAPVYVDFGNNECDAGFTVTINDYSVEVPGQ